MRRVSSGIAICAATVVALLVSGQNPAGQLSFIAPPSLPEGTGTISGTVFADRRPVAGAKVNLSAYDRFSPNYPWPYTSPREAITDARGRFRFEQVPELALKLFVTHAGFAEAVYGQVRSGLSGTPIQLTARQHFEADLHLTVGGSISGTFSNANGVPEGGLHVFAFRLEPMGEGEEGMMPGGEAVTSGDGSYRISNLPEGRFLMLGYRIRKDFGPSPLQRAADGNWTIESAAVYPDGWFNEQAQAVVLKESVSRRSVDLRLRWLPVTTIDGIVRNPDGSPAADAVVRLFPTNRQAFLVAEARSRADGTFAVERVPPGPYEIWAHSPDSRRWGATTFQSDGRRAEHVPIELQSGASLSGRLLYSGSSTPTDITAVPPLFLHRIQRSIYNNGMPGLVMTRGSSEFSYLSVPPGRYRISVSSPPPGWFVTSQMVDGVDAMDFPFEVRGQQAKHVAITLTDRLTEVAGTVVRAAGGFDLARTVVVFASDESYWTTGSRRIETIRPDTNGRYQVRGLPPGEYVAALGSAEIYGTPDAATLRTLRATGTRFTLASGERRSMDLRAIR